MPTDPPVAGIVPAVSGAAAVLGQDIIVIGASAGGVEALSALVRALPADLPAAVFIVLHVPAYGNSVLPDILNRAKTLPARHPQDNEAILPGRIYVAPPDHHLLVKPGRVRVLRGPSENGHRPAVDPLFRTAARAYGRRVAGVILSGTLDDGTAGLVAVKMRGGVAVVQNPDEAMFNGMPRSAVENVDCDWVVPLAEIGPTLVRLATTPLVPLTPSEEAEATLLDAMKRETDIIEMDPQAMQQDERPGTPSPFSCPECGGVLLELKDNGQPDFFRFRCRTGHAYSPDSLIAEQSEALEEALWAALRALEESAVLARRLFERARARGHSFAAARFAEQADDNDARAATVRQALLREQHIGVSTAPVVAEGNGSSNGAAAAVAAAAGNAYAARGVASVDEVR